MEQEILNGGADLTGEDRAVDNYSDLPPVRQRRGLGREMRGIEHPLAGSRQERGAGALYSGLLDDGNWSVPQQVRR